MSIWHTNEELHHRFHLIFEQNPTAVFALDSQMRIADANPAAVRVGGYSREDFVGKPVLAFVPPEQKETMRSMLERANQGETVRFQCSAYAAGGTLIEYNATVVPVIENDRITGSYALLENLTERLRAERSLASERDRMEDLEHDFRALFERNPDGVCLLSPEGTIVDVNEAMLETAGIQRDEVIGQNFRVFVEAPDLQRAFSFFRRALDGETVRYEISATSRRRNISLDVTLFPKYTRGKIAGAYCIVQDTTERKRAQRRQELQAQRVRDLYLLATTAEYTDAQVMSALQTGCRLLGMESGAIVLVGDRPRVDMRYDSLDLFGGRDEALLAVAQKVAQHHDQVAAHAGTEDETPYRAWIGTKVVVSGTMHGVLLFFSAISRDEPFEEIDHDTLALMSALVGAALERRRTRSHLRTLAYYDSLTGLPNRVFFQDRLRDALLDARGHTKSLAVIYFDLDRFKDINDSLGHAMGDRFLQMVARRLLDSIGNDGVVARMGGDEFIVLLEDDRRAAAAEQIAQDLLQVIGRPYMLDGYEQYVTASAGISVYPDDARDDEALIRNADMAMYQAKERGGSVPAVYTHALEGTLRSRVDQEKHLRRAIERAEFVLHFQPIVDVRSQRIVAVEALVRWDDEKRGLIYPDHFIPVAEATGLIVDVGQWVVKEAARHLARWREQGMADLTLSINISPRQFYHPDLCERMLSELERHGVPASALEIEITESMTLANVTNAIETVRKLKRIGASISVDDFGTGHSSLNYLRRFEVDEIKIDRSFVAGIGHQLSDETIVKAIVAMAQSLGIRIVAEGVETAAQYEFLKRSGCERVQGYYFSRPMEAAAFEQMVRERGTLLSPE